MPHRLLISRLTSQGQNSQLSSTDRKLGGIKQHSLKMLLGRSGSLCLLEPSLTGLQTLGWQFSISAKHRNCSSLAFRESRSLLHLLSPLLPFLYLNRCLASPFSVSTLSFSTYIDLPGTIVYYQTFQTGITLCLFHLFSFLLLLCPCC